MVIDTWTQTTRHGGKGMLEKMSTDDQGFNPVYMMSIRAPVVPKRKFGSWQVCAG